MAPTKPAVSMLFCHGGGFCKDVWTPVMKRLAATPLLQRVPPSLLTFDFTYHGVNRHVSEPATLHLDKPESPRVTHPAMHWAKWSKKDVETFVHKFREQEASESKPRTPLIGIGHSMGAAALWATEAANPGTFDGLILFEPMINVDAEMDKNKAVDFLVSITLKRRHQWDSFEEAKADIMSMRNFARWHGEALECYANGAVVEVDPTNNVLDPDSKYALSCHPHIEASLYCGPTLRLSEEEMAGVKCPITFQYGGLTQLFFPESKDSLIAAHPHLYSIAEAVPNTTHALVMEDIDTVVSRITDALAKLRPFNEASSSSKL